MIEEVGVGRLYVLDVEDRDDGWDAADAIDDGWSAEQVIDFIHDRKGHGVSNVKEKPPKKIEDYEYEQIRATLRKLKFHRLTPRQQWASIRTLRQALYPKREARAWSQRDDFDAIWDSEDKKRYTPDYLSELLRKQK